MKEQITVDKEHYNALVKSAEQHENFRIEVRSINKRLIQLYHQYIELNVNKHLEKLLVNLEHISK